MPTRVFNSMLKGFPLLGGILGLGVGVLLNWAGLSAQAQMDALDMAKINCARANPNKPASVLRAQQGGDGSIVVTVRDRSGQTWTCVATSQGAVVQNNQN